MLHFCKNIFYLINKDTSLFNNSVQVLLHLPYKIVFPGSKPFEIMMPIKNSSSS